MEDGRWKMEDGECELSSRGLARVGMVRITK